MSVFHCIIHNWRSEKEHCPTCNPKQDEDELWDDVWRTIIEIQKQEKHFPASFIINTLRERYTLIKK